LRSLSRAAGSVSWLAVGGFRLGVSWLTVSDGQWWQAAREAAPAMGGGAGLLARCRRLSAHRLWPARFRRQSSGRALRRRQQRALRSLPAAPQAM